jgi:hypothetical protein
MIAAWSTNNSVVPDIYGQACVPLYHNCESLYWVCHSLWCTFQPITMACIIICQKWVEWLKESELIATIFFPGLLGTLCLRSFKKQLHVGGRVHVYVCQIASPLKWATTEYYYRTIRLPLSEVSHFLSPTSRPVAYCIQQDNYYTHLLYWFPGVAAT